MKSIMKIAKNMFLQLKTIIIVWAFLKAHVSNVFRKTLETHMHMDEQTGN